MAGQIAFYTCCSCQSNYRSVIGLAQPVLCRTCSHERCARCAIWGSGEQDGDSLYGAEQEEAPTSYANESQSPTNSNLPQRRSTTSNTYQSPLLDDFGFRTVTGPHGSSYIGSPSGSGAESFHIDQRAASGRTQRRSTTSNPPQSPLLDDFGFHTLTGSPGNPCIGSRSRSRDDQFRMDKTASGRIHKAAGPSSSLPRRVSSFPAMDNVQTPPGNGPRANFLEGGICGTPSQMGTPVSLSGDSFSSTPYLSGASESPWDGSLYYDTPQLPEFADFNLGDSALAAMDADPSVGPSATKRKPRDHSDCPVRLEELLRKKPKKRRMTQPQQKVMVADIEDQKLLDRKRNTMHARNSRLNRTTYMEGLEMYQEWATPKIEMLEQQLEAEKEKVTMLQRENAALKPVVAPAPAPTDIAQNFGTPEPAFEGDWPVMDNNSRTRGPPHTEEPHKMSFFPVLANHGVYAQPNTRSVVSHPPLASPHPTISNIPVADPDTANQDEQDAILRALDEGEFIVSQLDAQSTTPIEPPSNDQWLYSSQPAPGPSSPRNLPHDYDVFDDPSLANLDPDLVFEWLSEEERNEGHLQDSPMDKGNGA